MFLAAVTFLCQSCSFYDDWEKIQRVTPLVNEVLNSQCFTAELRNMGVAERWIGAMTTFKGKVPVYFYFADNGTVGYTEPDFSKNVWLNKKFHDSFTLCQTGSNLAHEVLHLEGHRHLDAAYSVNIAFERCCVNP
jgi:hypothetical protein